MQGIWIIARFELLRLSRLPAATGILLLLPLLLIWILGTALAGMFQPQTQAAPAAVRAAIAWESTEQGLKLPAVLDAYEAKGKLIVLQMSARDEVESALAQGQADVGWIMLSERQRLPLGQAGVTSVFEFVPGRSKESNVIGRALLISLADHMRSEQMLPAVIDGLRAGATGAVPETNAIQDAALWKGADAALPSVGPVSGGPAYPAAGFAVRTIKIQPVDGSFTAFQYYAATMLTMFMLYAGMIAAISLVTDKQANTLSRLRATPLPTWHIILGKIMGCGILSCVQAVLIIGVTRTVYGVDWGTRLDLVFLVCLLFIVVSMSVAVLCSIMVKSVKTVAALFQFLALTLTFVSGGFQKNVWPPFTWLDKLSVSYWSQQSMLELMAGEVDSALGSVQVLAAVAIILAALSIAVYRKVGYQ